ncbi:DBR1-domain-containing protein [Penicillium odoratum]|uniref:DBR1-domain-containing protein n=1 Tax=Penicillium odoratum TaxID=1167516 RepID=UPI0025482030|nr:DBR1-domain-containing protein [Penicillium odoratum]KAJ5760327.1 DBR1-domain-containing protein [Penicillium odoratum]
MSSSLRIAAVGCGHGALNEIYQNVSIEMARHSWDNVDCVIIGGDFQSLRNSNDATCISVPSKYKSMGDFHEYYSGARTAPFLTIFCGGNHEAGNYLFELYYGGWVAPNIYYLGASNVLRLGPLRISGMSGIWKGYDYNKPHHERLPYNAEDVQSIYHIREVDVRKLLQVRTQVDIGLSHDWPRAIEKSGNSAALFNKKKHLRDDSIHGRLGSQAARQVLDRLRPAYWFSAHLHTRFALTMGHNGTTLQKADPSCDEPKEWCYTAAPTTPVKAKVNLGERTSPSQVISNSPGNEQSRLSAWQSSGETIAAKERADAEKRRAEFNDPSRPRAAPANFQVTWNEIKGEDRKVVATHQSVASQVQNDDEIDLDCSSPSASGSPPSKRATPAEMDGLSEKQAIMDHSIPEEIRSKLPASLAQAAPVDLVPEAIRSKLPASLTQPARDSTPKMGHPEAIQNRITKFLALDKPRGHDSYLELVELNAVSDQANTDFQRPFRLQYDKEWLAITRVFAQDLEVGEPDARVPFNKGEAGYLQAIQEAEAWVEENVVQRGKLDIPYNFVRVAPVFDQSVPVTTTDAPPEFPNPQTAAFCELVGIENKFALSNEECAARVARGARPTRSNFNPAHRRGARGGGRRGGRGGGPRGR